MSKSKWWREFLVCKILCEHTNRRLFERAANINRGALLSRLWLSTTQWSAIVKRSSVLEMFVVFLSNFETSNFCNDGTLYIYSLQWHPITFKACQRHKPATPPPPPCFSGGHRCLTEQTLWSGCGLLAVMATCCSGPSYTQPASLIEST